MLLLSPLAGCATTSKPVQRAYDPIPRTQSEFPVISHQAREGSAVPSASLWSASPESLFGDRRARGIGDILTVMVEIDDSANFNNSLSTSRQSNRGLSLGGLLGLPEVINRGLPDGASLDPAIDITSNNNVVGQGTRSRGESLSLTLAAQVVGITPNGDLAIEGAQDIQVDSETRQIIVSGYVRREDISRRNVISLDKIAGARVAYGGNGIIDRAASDRAGTRLLDKIIPF
ncbi:MAG: flagellar basal body L-ring protein FlgH [Pseudomonadota bacterium]